MSDLNKQYAVRIRSTGAILEYYDSVELCQMSIENNEDIDTIEDMYELNYYEIYDIENHVVIS